MKITRILLLLFVALATMGIGSEKEERKKAKLDLFTAIWETKQYNPYLLWFVLGPNKTAYTFLLYKPGDEFLGYYRVGKGKFINGKATGTFETPKVPVVPDHATINGIPASGTFSFSIGPDSSRTFTGELKGIKSEAEPTMVTVPIEASAVQFKNLTTKIVLEIAPKKKNGSYAVGDEVTFHAAAALRGKSGVSAGNPFLRFTLDKEVISAVVLKRKNITGCTVNIANSEILCDFALLGPKVVTASVDFKVTVPDELAGEKLTVKVGVKNGTPKGNEYDSYVKATAAERTAKVAIKEKN